MNQIPIEMHNFLITIFPIVLQVIDDSSADRVGMKPGDMILSVNGIDFTHLTHDEASDNQFDIVQSV